MRSGKQPAQKRKAGMGDMPPNDTIFRRKRHASSNAEFTVRNTRKHVSLEAASGMVDLHHVEDVGGEAITVEDDTDLQDADVVLVNNAEPDIILADSQDTDAGVEYTDDSNIVVDDESLSDWSPEHNVIVVNSEQDEDVETDESGSNNFVQFGIVHNPNIALHDGENATARDSAPGQGFECGCCFEEKPFKELFQCGGGHLFCATCLEGLVKEAAFGVGKTSVPCMSTEGCSHVIPISELRRALPARIYDQLIMRQQDEAIKFAENMGEIFRCPKADCGFAAEIDKSRMKVFTCLKCNSETCIECGKDWKDHFGLKCSEVEDDSATAARRKIEEDMTAAMMRTCWSCKVAFQKIDGCNKMTCRCGAIMCYICRKPIHKNKNSGYAHFCQHVLKPGAKCTLCTSCSLWTSPQQDDALRVAEAKKRAFHQVGHMLADGAATRHLHT